MQRKKKILFITLRSHLGGAPKHIDLLYENLKMKYNFYFGVPVEKPYGIKWKNINPDYFLELPHRKFSIAHLIRLLRFVYRNKIDIIHAHGKGGGVYGRLIKLFYPKIKIAFTFHGFHIDKYNIFLKFIYITIERFFSILTDKIINVSNGEQFKCLKYRVYNKKKSVVIYNALAHKDTCEINKSLLKDKLGLPKESFIILSLTRFDFAKNMKAAVTIADGLKMNKEILFLWAGDGEEKDDILEVITKLSLNNIKIYDFQEDVSDFLNVADLYLSTSLWEGLPFSLIEATQFGIPIIASNVTGNNEVVTDGFNGFLFDLTELEIASDKILLLKNDKLVLNNFQKNSINIFNDKFELKTMVEKTDELYYNL